MLPKDLFGDWSFQQRLHLGFIFYAGTFEHTCNKIPEASNKMYLDPLGALWDFSLKMPEIDTV